MRSNDDSQIGQHWSDSGAEADDDLDEEQLFHDLGIVSSGDESPLNLLDSHGPRTLPIMTEEEKEADEAALSFTYPPNPAFSGLPSTTHDGQVSIDMPADMLHSLESGPELGGSPRPAPGMVARTRNAGNALLGGASNTAERIMQTLGGMGGAIHKALRSKDRIADETMERGGDHIEVESDNDNKPRRNIRLRTEQPVTKNASLVSKMMRYKLYFQILLSLLCFFVLFRFIGFL